MRDNGSMAVRRSDWGMIRGCAQRGERGGQLACLLACTCVPPLRIVADDHQVIKMARARHLPTGGIFSKFDQATSGKIESEARQLA